MSIWPELWSHYKLQGSLNRETDDFRDQQGNPRRETAAICCHKVIRNKNLNQCPNCRQYLKWQTKSEAYFEDKEFRFYQLKQALNLFKKE